MKKKQVKAKTYYINHCANGGRYVSERPMNPIFFMTPAILKCVPTKRKRITRSGVFVGAICLTIKDEILRIVSIKNRKGYNLYKNTIES